MVEGQGTNEGRMEEIKNGRRSIIFVVIVLSYRDKPEIDKIEALKCNVLNYYMILR